MQVIDFEFYRDFSVKEVKELEVLIRVTHPGLVATYAWFRRKLDRDVYMIHELADCSLDQYMESTPLSTLRDEALVSQLSGLAGAISILQEHLVFTLFAGDPLDIDLEKILVFFDQIQCFQIQKISYPPALPPIVVSGVERGYWLQGQNAKYRSPELSKFSRSGLPASIWSLGCLFLDILVWHLNGFEELNAFRDLRESHRVTGIRDDGFYDLEETGLETRAKVKETVTEKLQQLLSNATEPLRSVVQIVQSMIQIDPEARPTAEEVEKKLANLI